MPKYEIDPAKHYKMPQDIQLIKHDGKTIVIAPESSNWVVLDSSSQTEVFNLFKLGNSIQDVLDSSMFEVSDIRKVITELEARKFCTKKVKSSLSDRNLHLYLTNKCNLSCPHCYMYAGKGMGSELSTHEWLRVLADYKAISKGNLLTISGGEPSCHADFDMIVKAASEMGFDIKLLTNGTLFKSERIHEISRYITSVQVSIDGYSEQSNSPIRGLGNFSKALSAVDTFLNCGIETSIALAPPIDSLHNHLEEFVDFAMKLSTRYKDKPFSIKFTEGLIKGRDIEPSDQFNREYSSSIRAIQERLYGPDYEVMIFVEKIRKNVITDSCMFGSIAISSEGNVFPCAQIGDLLPLANVRSNSMTEIYKKSLAAESSALITKLRPCNECALRYICGGGCRITEFPELVKRVSFNDIDYEDIPPRPCSETVKNRFYDLMIRSNKYLYSPL